MAPRRSLGMLSVAEKYDITQMIERGETRHTITEQYNISSRTLSIIKDNRAEIIEEFQNSLPGPSTSKVASTKDEANEKFETTLRQWYIRYRNKNITITHEMLGSKARELNTKMRGAANFKGSTTWVSSFKRHYGLREGDTPEDIEIGNEDEANKCKAQIKNLLQSGEYTLDNIYNADCLGILWTAVPQKSAMYKPSLKMSTSHGEKVTILLGANATGSHQLPVLVVGTKMNPPCLNSFRILTSIYRGSALPIIDSNLFDEWFDECFLKSVRERQQKIGRRMKTLLLLDNVFPHHETGIVSTKDESVKIMYLSYDAAPLIQPMDHGIIECFKRKYKIELLKTLVPCTQPYTMQGMVNNQCNLNLWDCCRMASHAWTNVSTSILKNAWDNLLKDESGQSLEEPEIRQDIYQALEELSKIPGCGGCDSIDVMNWFETNKKYAPSLIRSQQYSSALYECNYGHRSEQTN
ncbi:jerky protein homolog [Bombus huntii]|uniref:jerky protein homolog n=1 Tax=Bombus huntii TaxID=85661 RepID=UPI0021A9A9AA|nr:jerky protein homolog [Bombus huntii]